MTLVSKKSLYWFSQLGLSSSKFLFLKKRKEEEKKRNIIKNKYVHLCNICSLMFVSTFISFRHCCHVINASDGKLKLGKSIQSLQGT